MSRDLAPYIGALIAFAIIAWRLSKAAKGRPVTPSRLWIRPAVIGLFLLLALATSPIPGLLGFGIYAAAVVLGLGLGYLLARHQAFTLDPATGRITSKMSPVGTALFLGLFLARFAFKMAVTGGQAPDRMAAHSGQIMLYTDAGLLFVFALVAAQAWETWRRTKPMLDEHAASKANSPAN